MFEKRLFFHVDWILLVAVLLLASLGLAMIYSTTYVRLPDGSGHAGREFWIQLYALAIGGIALLVCLTIDYRFLAEHSLFLYAGLLGLLVFVLVAATARWARSAGSRSGRSSSSPRSSRG
jgi:rod shape determining protein RodA